MSSGDKHDIKAVRSHIQFWENMPMKLFWSWPRLNLQCAFQEYDLREQEWNNICFWGLWITRLGTREDATTQEAYSLFWGIFFGCKIKHNFVLEHSCVLNVLYSAQSSQCGCYWITSVSSVLLTHGLCHILVPALPPVLQFNTINVYW